MDEGDAAAEVAAAVLERTEKMEDMAAHCLINKVSQLQELVWSSRTTYAEEGRKEEGGGGGTISRDIATAIVRFSNRVPRIGARMTICRLSPRWSTPQFPYWIARLQAVSTSYRLLAPGGR